MAHFIDCGEHLIDSDKVKYFYMTIKGEVFAHFDDGKEILVSATLTQIFSQVGQFKWRKEGENHEKFSD